MQIRNVQKMLERKSFTYHFCKYIFRLSGYIVVHSRGILKTYSTLDQRNLQADDLGPVAEMSKNAKNI